MVLSIDRQIYILSILQSISGAVSFSGSAIVVFAILHSDERLKTPFHRIVFGLSVCDMIQSICYAFSFIILPSGSFACDLQGFFLFTGTSAAPMYNCSLCIYYVLVVCFNKKNDWVGKKVEPFLHLVNALWPLSCSIFLAATKNFNEAGPNCWVASSPRDCIIDPELECERGENAYQHRWLLSAVHTLVIFIFIVISMTLLSWKVIKQERMISRRFSFFGRSRNLDTPVSTGMQQTRKSKERQIVKQAFVYVAAYILPIVFPLAFFVVLRRTGKRNFGLWIAVGIFMPLQGLFNCIVYTRPKLIAVWRKHPDYSFLEAFLIAIKAKTFQKRNSNKNSSKVDSVENIDVKKKNDIKEKINDDINCDININGHIHNDDSCADLEGGPTITNPILYHQPNSKCDDNSSEGLIANLELASNMHTLETENSISHYSTNDACSNMDEHIHAEEADADLIPVSNNESISTAKIVTSAMYQNVSDIMSGKNTYESKKVTSNIEHIKSENTMIYPATKATMPVSDEVMRSQEFMENFKVQSNNRSRKTENHKASPSAYATKSSLEDNANNIKSRGSSSEELFIESFKTETSMTHSPLNAEGSYNDEEQKSDFKVT